MRSTNLPLFDLFQRQRRYVVPLFQRPYVWDEEEQWTPLWQDVLGRAEAVVERDQHGSRSDPIGNHFLGAVVLNQIRVYGRQVDTVEVIDGQQRLTTLQLMLAAFRDVISTTQENRLGDDLQRLTENDGVREAEQERLKIWPTNADRHDFDASMSAGSIEALVERYPLQRRKHARKPEPRPRLVEAYLFFAHAIRDFCFPAALPDGETEVEEQAPATFSAERAHCLYEALRRHIQLVVIELEEEDDPQVIFETLNARGVPLLPSDLIRNFVFLRASQQGEDAGELYTSWWSEYDERPAEADAGKDNRFWKQMERQGRLRRTRLDLFIHHYVQYRSGQDLDIGHLFNAFRAWWEGNPERSVAEELRQLRRHSDVFAGLFVPEGESRVDVFAKRLKALDTSTVYPVLLLLLVGGRERVALGELDGIVTDLESYLVRRMVCDLGTKNYNRFFLSMLQRLRGTDSISRGLIQKILLAPEGPAGEWPDDKKFLRAWLEKPAYETMKASRCAMVLLAIDHAMRGSKQEAITVGGPLTVEHVLPQSWGLPAWPEPPELCGRGESDETAVERRGRLLHSLGNLTLLTRALNSSVSNGAYDAKQPEIAKQSALRINTHFQDTLVWNEEEIQKRGRLLFDHALHMWPYPQNATSVALGNARPGDSTS
ncbi:MAG: DUF262 domain-containing HNH endonuclease family protein [Polyangiaceae bacterium]